ncbi:hypothetical protein Pan181_15470 [Aeoliella mucimassa]|uniref:Uncharacterized protein n=1 Tax=Aeoliella mucimassa TaxID=2527972 RepID=A0A518AKU3_9BACT|nr:hypothetical protein Pan181_15470 [Aeoliella mucimassa]
MQLINSKRLTVNAQRENRFPLDAFWEMGIYSRPKTTGFVECVQIQFSHRWVNWESIRGCWESIASSGAIMVGDRAWGELANSTDLVSKRMGSSKIGSQMPNDVPVTTFVTPALAYFCEGETSLLDLPIAC